MSAYSIPLPLLSYWTLTEDLVDHRKPEAFPAPSILQLMREQGRTYFYDSFTALSLPPNGPDHNRQRMALEAARHHDYALYLVFISLPDTLGHRHGAHSQQLRRGLGQMDHDLRNFVSKFEAIRPGSRYIFLGDHGMVNVERHLDVEGEIKRIARQGRLRLGRDFVYFLDSTLMRLWTLTDKAQTVFPRKLQTNTLLSHNGLFLDESLAKAHHIPWNDRLYGDVVWWASPGTLIFPDFFHRTERYKAMHGYDPALPESQGMCIVWGPGIAQQKIDTMPLAGAFHLLREVVEV
jgi:predicted AlkP superfamily pyrophosphatase or phosphodiesterase